MKNSFFTISMGFVNREPHYTKTPDQNNIYTDIMRGLGQGLLRSGAKIYLPYPVELIKSEEEICDIIAHSGYCMMSFERGMSKSHVIRLVNSIVRSYAYELVSQFDNELNEDSIQVFAECFKPYVVSVDSARAIPLAKSMSQLNEAMQRGRNLTLDTKRLLLKVLNSTKAVA
ncbi:hypothetical protein [Roseivirga sp. E12]|uniref:hypothetical protein n=1 Tax=Roseivirga sp. E12 TaxID=2819237 RepID=UPI001ABC6FF1|nr:hypothetical protein [Roseivirga sp. E12]MBO3698492.1 hypothetical protein [Roseivirga sp. E12]